MIEVTNIAAQKIKEYLEQNKVDSPVRVALLHGCGGPSLGLAVDDAKGGDQTIDQDGFQLVIDNQLMQQCGEVKVDFVEPGGEACACGGHIGFTVSSSKVLGGGGGCGGTCGSGSCGC